MKNFRCTAWKVSVFGIILLPIFQSKMQENGNQNNSEYGHFLRSAEPSKI